MLKKLLYVLASFILGFILILSTIYSNFHSAFQYLCANEVSEKEYVEAERFFSRSLNKDKFYEQTFENGVHVEVFSAVNDGVRHCQTENGKVSYYTLESTIQFTLFHLTDTFALEDQKDEAGNVTSYGGVELKLEGVEQPVFFPFISEGLDNYALVPNYSFLVLTVNYDDYVAKLAAENIPLNTPIVAATIYDSKKDDVYQIEFAENQRPSFDTDFHKAYTEVLKEYNEQNLNIALGKTTDEEKSAEILTKFQTITTENGFILQHEVGIIYGSFKFLFPVISTGVVFLGIDILLGWLLFRKKNKRTAYMPKQKQINEVKKRPEPEQFTRNVFDLEEDDVVETKVEEEA